MNKSITGFNAAAKGGKDAAMRYCQGWREELNKASSELARELAAKKINATTYNYRRGALNEKTKDLNDCIAAMNKHFG